MSVSNGTNLPNSKGLLCSRGGRKCTIHRDGRRIWTHLTKLRYKSHQGFWCSVWFKNKTETSFKYTSASSVDRRCSKAFSGCPALARTDLEHSNSMLCTGLPSAWLSQVMLKQTPNTSNTQQASLIEVEDPEINPLSSSLNKLQLSDFRFRFKVYKSNSPMYYWKWGNCTKIISWVG